MNYLDVLNEKQREAVLHTGVPLLILAGAGSGKTRVITTKIAWLIDQVKCDPRSILGVTFTNKAADEMKKRILTLAEGAENVMIRTFHSFGAWLLRRNASSAGLSPYFTIYDTDDTIALLKSIIREKISVQILKWRASQISKAKDMNLIPSDDLEPIDSSKEFALIYGKYQARLEETGNADFGDLIMKPVRLLRANPIIKKRLQDRFSIILVDEFQDSNKAQFELLSELYSGENYLCVVGDEDQSIYSFRGAEVKNIVEFPNIFTNTKVIMLEQNYRSTANILKLAGKVVGNNEYRLGKNLWTENEDGTLPALVSVENQDEEALFCLHLLKDRNFGGTAILYRNNYQSRVFESLFLKKRIPYRIVGTLRFYEREEIKDIICYLRFLINYKDDVSFTRIVNKPQRGIGAKNIEKILSAAGGDLFAKCRESLSLLSGKAKDGIRFFISTIEEAAAMFESHALSEMVHHLIVQSGLYDHYKEIDKRDGTGKVKNLEEIVNATAGYPGGIEGLNQFLETTVLNNSDEDPYAQEKKVTLITIHNTKGLEFDRVILTGLEDGLFPHISESTLDDSDRLEEERRLFYVGVTRAKNELYLSWCKNRLVFGQYMSRYPSRFLQEIPEECIQSPAGSAGTKKNKKRGFAVGMRVMHTEYGYGIVKNKWDDEGDELLIVQFDSGRSLQFIAGYSNLEKLEE